MSTSERVRNQFRSAALVLLAGTVFLSPALAQEVLEFNVPYHCQDGTDKIITRCQSNPRGEVCFWRVEKNGQLIVEVFNIRSQMDGWLKVCKVQTKASVPSAASAAPSALQPTLQPALQRGQALNPPYLTGMPSVDLVKREIQGKDPTDTLARQVAVFNMLPEVIQRFQLADRARYNPTPDEQKVTGQYNLAAYELEQGYKKTHTPAEAQELFRLHGRYELDAALDREMYGKLFSPAFMEEYRKINKSVDQWYQAHLDQERHAGEEQRAQASASPGGSTFVRNDPGTLAARRCVELGGSDLECVGKGLSTGLMDMFGLGTGLNLNAAARPSRVGLVIAGQYQSGNGVRLKFGDETAVLAGCGTLIDLPLDYTVTRQGASLLIQLASNPKPFTTVLGLDGNLSGPGSTDVEGQIITGYRHYTAYKRRVSDNTIVPGSQHEVSEPIYGPKLERCVIGALPSTGPVPSADLLAFVAAAAGDASQQKTTPAGPRMSGAYQNSGGLKIQFASEGAVLDCGEAHVAAAYTVRNDAAALRITLDKAGGPLLLTWQPNGTLSGTGTADVRGRVVSGSTPNGIAFAPRNTECPVGILIPNGTPNP
jgi:hypothetical protein